MNWSVGLPSGPLNSPTARSGLVSLPRLVIDSGTSVVALPYAVVTALAFGGRTPLSRRLALLCFVLFGWNFTTVASHSLQPYRGCALGNSLCGVGCYVRHSWYTTRGRKWGSFVEARTNAGREA
mgnify:CR=1 FL=1